MSTRGRRPEPTPPSKQGIVYQIISTMTGHTYSDVNARTVWTSQIAAIAAFNDSRSGFAPSYSAQTQWKVTPFKIHSVK